MYGDSFSDSVIDIEAILDPETAWFVLSPLSFIVTVGAVFKVTFTVMLPEPTFPY